MTAVNMSNTTGWAAYPPAYANFNTISQSTMPAAASPPRPFRRFVEYAERKLLDNLYGARAEVYCGANYNNAGQNTITGNGGGSYALEIFIPSSNAVSGGFILNTSGFGAYLYGGSRFNTITNSTITSNAIGAAGLWLSNASSNTFMNVYVQGSTGAIIQGSTGTIIGGSMFVSTWTGGLGINLRNGSVNLTLSSTTLAGGPQGMGLYLNLNNSGTLALFSNTIAGGSYGLYITTQSAGTALSITSMTFANLTAGATAINFLGGQFVSTFTGVSFDASVFTNVNGGPLNPGSRIQILNYAGPKRGPAFESDPYGYVDWGYAPAAVTNLAATVLSTGNVNLNWTAPGEDMMTGVLNNSTFTIQYTSVALDAQNPVFWYTAAAQLVISTTAVAPGTSQYYALPGLIANTVIISGSGQRTR